MNIGTESGSNTLPTQGFAVSGVTVSGNLGGQAMLLATLQQLRRLEPMCRVGLLSVFPDEDRRHALGQSVDIVDSRPVLLVIFYSLLSLVVWPFARTRPVKRLLKTVPYFRTVIEARAVLDHSGIAFSDGRGLPVLAYNVACCLPAIAVGTPLIKLPQALGPFRTASNRLAARFVLSRCQRIYTRGSLSARNVRDLGIAKAEHRPDVTFALEVPDTVRAEARQRLNRTPASKPLLVVAPSRVVARYCMQAGIDFIGALACAIGHAHARGFEIVVLAHSHGRPGSSNDDHPTCRALVAACNQRIELIDDVTDATLARALIGEGNLFIGSRFHAIVGSLAMGVPTLALGWSHKYAEVLTEFGLEEYAIDYRNISPARLTERLDALNADAARLADEISATAQRMRDRVREMYASLLRERAN